MTIPPPRPVLDTDGLDGILTVQPPPPPAPAAPAPEARPSPARPARLPLLAALLTLGLLGGISLPTAAGVAWVLRRETPAPRTLAAAPPAAPAAPPEVVPPASGVEEAPPPAEWVAWFARDGVAPLETLVPDELLRCERLEIVGHTDRVGSDEVNLVVGAGRAEAVARLLVSRGIARSAVVTRSAGESEPLASGDGADAHRRNRRAVVRCLP